MLVLTLLRHSTPGTFPLQEAGIRLASSGLRSTCLASGGPSKVGEHEQSMRKAENSEDMNHLTIFSVSVSVGLCNG